MPGALGEPCGRGVLVGCNRSWEKGQREEYDQGDGCHMTPLHSASKEKPTHHQHSVSNTSCPPSSSPSLLTHNGPYLVSPLMPYAAYMHRTTTQGLDRSQKLQASLMLQPGNSSTCPLHHGKFLILMQQRVPPHRVRGCVWTIRGLSGILQLRCLLGRGRMLSVVGVAVPRRNVGRTSWRRTFH
jgi:hypothetical protein